MKLLCLWRVLWRLFSGVTVTTFPDMKYSPTVNSDIRHSTNKLITKYFFNFTISQEHTLLLALLSLTFLWCLSLVLDWTWTLMYDLVSSSGCLLIIVSVLLLTRTREELVSGTTVRENFLGLEYMSSIVFPWCSTLFCFLFLVKVCLTDFHLLSSDCRHKLYNYL